MQRSRITVFKTDVLTSHHTSGLQSKMPRNVGGPRGRIKGSSPASLRRLNHWMRNTPTTFRTYATLTYGGYPPTDVETIKKHRKALIARLRRLGVGLIGRMQEQERGAPHYHLILTHDIDKDKLLSLWRGVTKDSTINNVVAGPIRNFQSVLNYMICDKQSCEIEGVKSWFYSGVDKPDEMVFEDESCQVEPLIQELKKQRECSLGKKLPFCGVNSKKTYWYGMAGVAKQIIREYKGTQTNSVSFSDESGFPRHLSIRR